jgi:hypothetical protein
MVVELMGHRGATMFLPYGLSATGSYIRHSCLKRSRLTQVIHGKTNTYIPHCRQVSDLADS